MTNAQIIFNEQQVLAEQGVLQYTGREAVIELEDGTKAVIKEVEEIHTFAKWKALGRQVKKGEHAKAAFMIWKQGKASKKAQEEAEKNGEEAPQGKMFMKKAFFFTFDQTEPVNA